MVDYKFVSECGFHYFKYLQPLILSDIIVLYNRLIDAQDDTSDLSLPMFADLRSVSMINVTAQELKTHARALARYAPQLANNTVVYLVANSSDFGMMRMFSAYSEIEGYRTEDHVLITEVAEQAIEWVENACGCGARGCDALNVTEFALVY